jgi:ABC-type transport system involved in multi-copper enzyme maturation permease subunit
MTKLEDLTALLVNEINDFKNGVEKLENINDQLKDTKIKMDLLEYKTMIYSHQKEMASHIKAIERFENRFNNKIIQAKIYPTWAVIVFIVCIVVTVVLASYMFLK